MATLRESKVHPASSVYRYALAALAAEEARARLERAEAEMVESFMPMYHWVENGPRKLVVSYGIAVEFSRTGGGVTMRRIR